MSATGLSLYNSGNLKELAIPKNYSGLNVTAIGDNAFKGKEKIKVVILDSNIVTLGTSCFSGCTGIEKLTIPISLNATGAKSSSSVPFYGVNKLKQINFTKGNKSGVDYYDGSTGNNSSYQSTPWYISKDIAGGLVVTFEEGITRIGNVMFKNCTGIKTINYNNISYSSLNAFKVVFESSGGTISSSAFTGSGF